MNRVLLNKIFGEYLALILRVALGITFIYASIDKIQNPIEFAKNINNYQMLPTYLISIMALTLPWIELISGIFLTLGIWRRSCVMIINTLLVVFIIAIIRALVLNLDISCGCFTTDPNSARMNRWTLYWDIIWFIWGAHVFLFDKGKFALVNLMKHTIRKNA